LNAKSIWLNAVTVASCPGPPASKPTDASPAPPELDPDVLPELLALVPEDPPEALPDELPPLVPDPLAPPEPPVLDVPPEALPEPLVDEPELPELVPDPFDVLASPQSPGEEDVPQAAEPATIATQQTRSVVRTPAS
jgi:hypothetical protein